MDRYIIENDGKMYCIYPLAEFKIENEEYILYTNKGKAEDIENIYVGQLINNKIVKVEETKMPILKSKIYEIINELTVEDNI